MRPYQLEIRSPGSHDVSEEPVCYITIILFFPTFKPQWIPLLLHLPLHLIRSSIQLLYLLSLIIWLGRHFTLLLAFHKMDPLNLVIRNLKVSRLPRLVS